MDLNSFFETGLAFSALRSCACILTEKWKDTSAAYVLLFTVLVLQMIVTALVYLLLQSTLTCLNFLELWVPLDVVSCVALAYTNTLFRIIILPVSLWMVIER